MRFLLCLALFLLPGLLWAGVVPQQVPTTDTLLQGFFFGQSPDDEMICIKGPCLAAADDPAKVRTIISSYQKPVDITHLAGVEISTPRYDFFDHALFRVSFSLYCSDEEGPVCIKAIAEELQASLELKLQDSVDDIWGSGEQLQLLVFSNASGVNVHVDRRKSAEGWSRPSIAIYDGNLMNLVRQAANPNYLPK